MSEPLSVTAGDTWSWTRSESAYPASVGWVLTYYFAMAAETPKEIVTTASGDDHVAQLAATSTGWDPGEYRWTVRAALGAERFTLGTGILTVLPDPSAVVDRRTWEAKVVAALEPALLASAGNVIVEYEIDGVKCKNNRPEAMAMLRECRVKVRMQQGKSAFSLVPVRFA